MLQPNPQLSKIRNCFGNWSSSQVACVGEGQNRGCEFSSSCRTQVNHMVLAGQLNRNNRPAAPPPPAAQHPAWQTSPSPPPQYNPAPQQTYMQPHTPPGAAPQPQYHPQQYVPAPPPYHAQYGANQLPSMPVQVEGVRMLPHATAAPGSLSTPESRAPGRKAASLFFEVLRSALKGGAQQASNFFDEVPFDPLDPRTKR